MHKSTAQPNKSKNWSIVTWKSANDRKIWINNSWKPQFFEYLLLLQDSTLSNVNSSPSSEVRTYAVSLIPSLQATATVSGWPSVQFRVSYGRYKNASKLEQLGIRTKNSSKFCPGIRKLLWNPNAQHVVRVCLCVRFPSARPPIPVTPSPLQVIP